MDQALPLRVQQLRFDAIIFDHDGTLVDSVSQDFLACKMLFDELGLQLQPEHWAAMVCGQVDAYDRLFEQLASQHPRLAGADLKSRLQSYWDVTLTPERLSLMPGVTPLLEELRRGAYRMAVATAAPRGWAQRWLCHFGIDSYFEAVVGRDDVRQTKPEPDVYLHAASLLGVEPSRCLAFEDSLPGVSAARAAGMTVVAVTAPLTRSIDFSDAHVVIDGLAQVTGEWLHGLVGGLG